MRFVMPILVAVVLTGALSACDNDRSTIYSHDESSMRFDADKNLIIRVPDRPPLRIDARHRLYIGQAPVALTPKQQQDVTGYYDTVAGTTSAEHTLGHQGAAMAFGIVENVASKLVHGDFDDIDTMVDDRTQPLLASVAHLCDALDKTVASQRRLAKDVAAFRPYTLVSVDDASECRSDVAENRASD